MHGTGCYGRQFHGKLLLLLAAGPLAVTSRSGLGNLRQSSNVCSHFSLGATRAARDRRLSASWSDGKSIISAACYITVI